MDVKDAGGHVVSDSLLFLKQLPSSEPILPPEE